MITNFLENISLTRKVGKLSFGVGSAVGGFLLFLLLNLNVNLVLIVVVVSVITDRFFVKLGYKSVDPEEYWTI